MAKAGRQKQQQMIDELAASISPEMQEKLIHSFFQRNGFRGGTARAKALTPERRSEIATHAITTRWARKRAQQKASTAAA